MKTCDIVGLGVISVAGLNLKENWEVLCKGESCIREIREINTNDLQTRNAGQIYLSDDELRALVNDRIGKLKSDKRLPAERAELLLLLAFEEARIDAGISVYELQTKRVGLFVGTSLSGFTRLEKEYQLFYERNRHIRPSSFLTYPLHVCIDRLAYEYSISGPRYLFSTACSASLHPFVIAKELLEHNKIDIAIIGGTDPLSMMSLAGFSSLKSLAEEKCSPYSNKELGISIGEGAGVVIIKSEVDQPKYASILNVAGTSDAYHPTASNPTGETIRICIQKAMDLFDHSEKDFYVMSHGTGTAHNDLVETRSIKQVEALKKSWISAAKSVIGHTLGASGAIELVYLTQALREQKALPIANFTEPRPGCDLNYVKNDVIPVNNAIGIKNAFAFGGNNVSIAIGAQKIAKKIINHSNVSSKVVITGIGIVSPMNVFENEQIIEKFFEGKTYIKEIPPVRGFNRPVNVSSAALIEESLLENLCNTLRIKNTRKMDRISQLACAASALALKDSGLKVTTANAVDIGLISATGTGALASVSEFYINMLEKGVKFADANIFPNTVVNAHLGYVSIEHKIKGYTTVIAQGSSSPYASLNIAKYLLEKGVCKAVLVGSVSEYSETYHRALIDIGYVKDTKSLDSYSNELNGNVLGEGSVFFTLEREDYAVERGAPIKAYLEKVVLDSEPSFPSTYQMDRNPLKKVLYEFKSQGFLPSYIAGEGNGLEIENKLETEAFKEYYEDVSKTSASPYFGMASGVVPFYNLALFCLLSKHNIVPGVPHNKESNSGRILYGLVKQESLKSILVGTVSAGGSAGALFAKKAKT
ncbi:beta-ketoacyl synthase N-terminal-like domain-containing protein [Gracilinema caldarium]|uniref:beta-ketoacyl synthase N-terminal-like domain-containing protein n=1 Tax=Gracilinema caldarium TaxID=215591 RepID=UPI0026EE62A1|nr:beta-ketoacyl synthase N-terminal-like domain-containing protein [Gracilinema caldarium]